MEFKNDGFVHRSVQRDDGTSIAYTSKGDGPMVLMVHGFPESWYSFRHQIDAVAEAGYSAVAIHLRGYGNSDKPTSGDAYISRETAADVIAVIDDAGAPQAVLIGHDVGAVVAQKTALLYPDRIRGLVLLSVPTLHPFPADPLDVMKSVYPDNLFYMEYFHDVETASRELESDIPRFLKLAFHWLSGTHPDDDSMLVRPAGSKSLLSGLEEPSSLPDWLNDDDFQFFVDELTAGGLAGPVSAYPAVTLDHYDLAEYASQQIEVPTMFVGGNRDSSRALFGYDSFAEPLSRCTDPRGAHILPGIGHWIQQEAPDQVSALVLEFLDEIKLPT
ncbi:alpha/beta fold hydrolase [Rhodococcus sp. NPDC057014]|uniref:alpha/beta fold hydrolase n=1 Tax=Rhodococcus sp. NPDC057014 TaxID=3346000 RepID=UPI0036328C64